MLRVTLDMSMIVLSLLSYEGAARFAARPRIPVG